MLYNDKQASTDSEKAQLFNNYFYSLFSPSGQPINDFDTTLSSDTLQDIVLSQPDVSDILTSLDTSKASGIDNISPNTVLHLYYKLHMSFVLHKFAE